MSTILRWIVFESNINANFSLYGIGASKNRFKLQKPY
ncbi:hypothetical protein PP176A_1791 [Sporanaerobacter sp. PP17-6a]|nr:hypothetical protein PP176A_1791 [Sporanaerobacter sp. PP17-6a]